MGAAESLSSPSAFRVTVVDALVFEFQSSMFVFSNISVLIMQCIRHSAIRKTLISGPQHPLFTVSEPLCGSEFSARWIEGEGQINPRSVFVNNVIGSLSDE